MTEFRLNKATEEKRGRKNAIILKGENEQQKGNIACLLKERMSGRTGKGKGNECPFEHYFYDTIRM